MLTIFFASLMIHIQTTLQWYDMVWDGTVWYVMIWYGIGWYFIHPCYTDEYKWFKCEQLNLLMIISFTGMEIMKDSNQLQKQAFCK